MFHTFTCDTFEYLFLSNFKASIRACNQNSSRELSNVVELATTFPNITKVVAIGLFGMLLCDDGSPCC